MHQTQHGHKQAANNSSMRNPPREQVRSRPAQPIERALAAIVGYQ